MGVIEQRIRELAIELPSPWNVPAQFNFVTVALHGRTAYVSGHGPLADGRILYRGQVGRDLGETDAYAAARATMLLMLASLKQALGNLDRITRIVKVFGMVNAAPDFDRHPAVINGASDLLETLWGPERGKHARSAVGMASLPMGIAVELEMIAEFA
ncbi:MAG: RidA family protein [Chloroflexi bacterium]|nr:RidA family protein [Chloroflexota bacterium]